ncbi:MAG: acyl--CoA ligase [Alphaproteobacteria bacterium]|nr:acyl--CoA ligase [Alphaproteobacteria bacterium]
MATGVNAQHDLAIPFASTAALLARYRTRDPNKTAIVDLDQDKSISFGALAGLANRIAHALERRGLKQGDRIAVLADETIEKLLVWIGIWRFGAVVCPLNVEMNQHVLHELLATIGPKLTLIHAALDTPEMRAGIPGPVVRFDSWSDDLAGDAASGEFFREVATLPALPEHPNQNGRDDVSAIFCTSGTTAKPKCVVYNHFCYWLSGLSTLDMLGLDENDRTLEYRSFGWNSAQILSFMPFLQTGLTLHIAKRFSHSRFFDWIQRYGLTFAAGVPTVVNMLLNEPRGITADDVPTLRLMTCSTAPLSPEQWEKFERMYGVTLLQLYGMSEAGWICGNRHYRRRMGTVGPPAKHQEFLIVDGAGRLCPPGAEGEVEIGGPQTHIGVITPEGVYEDRRGTRMRTGDLAVMDEDGFVRVTGRTKDLIIRGGVNIAPVEIDNVLLTHPDVLEAAVVGVPDAIYGEEVVAYVTAKPGAQLSPDDVKAHCARALPAFKAPKRIVVLDTLPRSDRGKVRRDALKDQWLKANAPA